MGANANGRRSDAQRAAAALAVAGGDGSDAVGARAVAGATLERERAAARPRRAGHAGEHVAVAAQDDRVVKAGAVAIDFELDLQSAVVGLGLQLPGGRARAVAAAGD